jgi:hypothetical protein
METNSRLEEMRETAIAYNTAKAIRGKDREAMIEADDWDGVKVFDEREKADFPYPFTQGAVKALTAYDRSLKRGADAFEGRGPPMGERARRLRSHAAGRRHHHDRGDRPEHGAHGRHLRADRTRMQDGRPQDGDARGRPPLRKQGTGTQKRHRIQTVSHTTPRRNRRGIAA